MNKIGHIRMLVPLLVSIALTAIIAIVKPELLGVSIYKLSLNATACWGMYWFDRWAFPYARPDMFLTEPWSPGQLPVIAPGEASAFAASMLRRAVLMAGAMIGVSLGA